MGLSGIGQGSRQALRAAWRERTRRSSRHGPKRMATTSPRGGGLRRRDEVALGGEVQRRDGKPVGDCAAADAPRARAGQVRCRTGPRPAPWRRDRAGARPRSPIPRARRSAALRRSPDRAGRTRRTCAPSAPGSSDQKAACSTSIGSAPRLRAAACEWRHMSCSARVRRFRIAREIPRRGERDDALDIGRGSPRRSPSFRRGNSRSARRARRCCAAKAAAIPRHGRRPTARDRSSALPQSSSSARRPIAAIAPVKRNLLVEIEDSRRIDQRGDEHRRRSFAAVIAQGMRRERARFPASAAAARAAARCSYARSPASASRGKLRIAFRHLPYQFEKQRKRARRAFMLQRTMLR